MTRLTSLISQVPSAVLSETLMEIQLTTCVCHLMQQKKQFSTSLMNHASTTSLNFGNAPNYFQIVVEYRLISVKGGSQTGTHCSPTLTGKRTQIITVNGKWTSARCFRHPSLVQLQQKLENYVVATQIVCLTCTWLGPGTSLRVVVNSLINYSKQRTLRDKVNLL